nr:alpha-2-macroglobulin-like protein 1 [Pelodiscus sinensis]|eukprot:XP_006134884.1 alpha-2-macroglobulin-like protein 1 [Pelodiscus sinensis]
MVEVELTAYVLLAHLSLPNVSAADLATASQIARWLSKQENLYKVSVSIPANPDPAAESWRRGPVVPSVTLLPQNTVVALQALARYAALTYSASGTVSVTVSSPAGARQQFHVENANRLELQRAALQEIPGQYTVQASGSGCVFVQLILRYNVPPPKSAATFELRVETEPKECSEGAASRFSLALHARYQPGPPPAGSDSGAGTGPGSGEGAGQSCLSHSQGTQRSQG